MARHLNRPGTPGQQKKSLEAERSWSVMWWLQYVGRDRMLPVNPARLRSAENDANGKGLRTWVLNDFRVAAISAAAPALRAVELTYEAACVCATVTSQVRGFPDCHGTKVSPSGRLPLLLLLLLLLLFKKKNFLTLVKTREGKKLRKAERGPKWKTSPGGPQRENRRAAIRR